MADFAGKLLPVRMFRATAFKDRVGRLIAGTLRGGGGSPPTITNIHPPAGSAIAASATLSRDVIDTDSTVTSALFAKMGDTWEVVFDGASFSPRYSSSTRSAITNGHRFAIRRNGGWPTGSIIISSVDVDATGQAPE